MQGVAEAPLVREILAVCSSQYKHQIPSEIQERASLDPRDHGKTLTAQRNKPRVSLFKTGLLVGNASKVCGKDTECQSAKFAPNVATCFLINCLENVSVISHLILMAGADRMFIFFLSAS